MITKELFQQWLSDNHCVYIVSKTDETSGLPDHLMENPVVKLQIGLNMAIAIPDLKVTDEGWSGTLSFSRRGRYIYCPFDAILQVSAPNEWGGLRIYPPDGAKPPKKTVYPTGENIIAVDFRNRRRVVA